jgi:D-2-hydroxyacid dehydrogenase (NADP+)
MKRSICVLNGDAAQYAEAISPRLADFEVAVCRTREEAISMVPAAEILVALDLHVDDELMALAGNLRWIHALTSGTDTILGLRTLRPDVIVTSSSGASAVPMSEHAISMMLALIRDLPRTLTNQRNAVWERWPSPSLNEKTVCLIGMGASSSEIARKCKAFGMGVLGVSSTRRSAANFDKVFVREEIQAAVSEADFVISLVPLSKQTFHLLDAEVLGSMKQDGFFINMSRGSVVDEGALIKHLESGRLRGAALDVFESEPLAQHSPLWKLPNVIVTPHVAGAAQHYVELTLPLLLDNLSRYREGKELRNVVRNPATGRP